MKKVKKHDNHFEESRKCEMVKLNRQLPTKVSKGLKNLVMWHFVKLKASKGVGAEDKLIQMYL